MRSTSSGIATVAFAVCTVFLPLAARAQGAWSNDSSTGFRGRYGAASSSAGGKIYVMGGMDLTGQLIGPIQVFDPATHLWNNPATTGTFTSRLNPASAEVGGKFYVMGGVSGSQAAPLLSNVLEVFDPATNSWSTPTTTGTFTARYGLRAATVNGKIYVMGGSAGPPSAPNEVDILEVFDPSTNVWSTPSTSGSFTGRRSFSCSVFNDKIYVFGGNTSSGNTNTVEVFDPATNTWSKPAVSGASTARKGVASSLLNGHIYVMGGDAGNYLSTVEVFDPSGNSWMTLTTDGNFTARTALNAEVVNGKIYAIGGLGSGGALSTTEVFTLGSNGVKKPNPSEFTLSPNPTDGVISVHSPANGLYQVTAFNLLGERVLSLTEEANSGHSLDLSRLPSGAYWVRLITGGTTTTHMIVRR